MGETASNSKVFMAGLVVGLIIAFLVAGLVTYGFSAEVRDRVWHDLLERPSPLFRFPFILQPVMAGITFARPNHAVRPLATREKARLMKSDDAMFERRGEAKVTRPRLGE